MMDEPVTHTITVTVRCRLAWWFKPYVALLLIGSRITGFLPSDAHLKRVADRALTTSVSKPEA